MKKYLSVKLVGQILWIIFQSRNHEYQMRVPMKMFHISIDYWDGSFVGHLATFKFGAI